MWIENEDFRREMENGILMVFDLYKRQFKPILMPSFRLLYGQGQKMKYERANDFIT